MLSNQPTNKCYVWQSLNCVYLSFTFFGWNINQWRRRGNWSTRKKTLMTSFWKCHILKHENSSPNQDLSTLSSIGGMVGKQMCLPLHHSETVLGNIRQALLPVSFSLQNPYTVTDFCFGRTKVLSLGMSADTLCCCVWAQVRAVPSTSSRLQAA